MQGGSRENHTGSSSPLRPWAILTPSRGLSIIPSISCITVFAVPSIPMPLKNVMRKPMIEHQNMFALFSR